MSTLKSLSLAVLVTIIPHLAQAAATFVPNAQPRGWVTQPALSSYVLRNGGIYYRFVGSYDLGSWSGDIYADEIDSAGNYVEPYWSATTVVGAQNYDTGRKIVTVKSDGTNIPFRWASLSATQQTSVGDATNGPKILNFIRGDRSNEDPNGSKLRARDSVIGPVVHSSIIHWQHDSTTRRVYAGANDGMLHVLNADTGEEQFAYIPSMLIGNLKNISVKPYTTNDYFVDGGFSIANATISSVLKTILVGGLGAGGKGLFALDITTPTPTDEADAATKIKWEISPSVSGYANLGYTYGTPKLARLNDGTAVAIAGNGYVNSGNGHATLLVIDLDTGTLIKEIDTGSGSTGSPNGLSSPTLRDTNSDGKVDYAYAGDLDGHLWKFDLSGSDPTAYSATNLYTTSPAQAITVPPVIQLHPNGGYLVMFATGRTLTATDMADNSVHYAYGIWDGAPVINTQLLDQTFTEGTYTYGISPDTVNLLVRTASVNTPNWLADASTGHMGWRMSLGAGERVVGESPTYNDGRYYFISTNPTHTNAALPNGRAWLNELNYLTGGRNASPIFDLNANQSIASDDLLNGIVVNSREAFDIDHGVGEGGLRSQLVLFDTPTFGNTYFNANADLVVTLSAPPDRGVSGGHFDYDIYYGPPDTKNPEVGIRKKHIHEYDDVYDVVGVNMLNASSDTLNLSKANNPGIPFNSTTQFKILVMNQYINPAVTLKIGPSAVHTSVKNYQGMASATDAATLITSLPIYTQDNIGNFEFKLPLDAFKSKDWWGDGGTPRSGLIPTEPGCVYTIDDNGFPGRKTRVGPNGENHDGALTIQVIKSTTPASAIELNVLNHPEYGWRVKRGSNFKTYVIVSYTAYWHHPTDGCYGESGWVPNPLEDPVSDATAKPRATGSADPIGAFNVGDGGTVTSHTVTTNGNTTTEVTTYSDGSTYTEVTVINDDRSKTVTQTLCDDGNNCNTVTQTIPNTSTVTGLGGSEILSSSGRITWRQIIQ